MPIFNELPPTDRWPKEVTDLVDELSRAQERARAANRALVELVGDDSPGARDGILLALEKQDKAAMAEAARNGEKIPTRRPATERHAEAIEAARSEIVAANGAVELVSAELQRALNEHAAQIGDALDLAHRDATTLYANSITNLVDARAALHATSSARAWLNWARTAGPGRVVNYSNDATPTMAGAQPFGHGDFGRILDALRAELDAHRPSPNGDIEDAEPDAA